MVVSTYELTPKTEHDCDHGEDVHLLTSKRQ